MISALTLALVTLSPGPATLVLNGLDPIELAAGRETAGLQAHTSKHLRYEYRFASKSNKERFDAEPLHFAVQQGGACGSMGPLSGRGNPARWTVADGRVFLFASEQCRDNFLANKKLFLAQPPAFAPTEERDPSAALALWQKVRKAHNSGGLDRLKSVSWSKLTPYEQAGKKRIWGDHMGFFGGQTWGRWYTSDGEGQGYFAKDHARWEMDRSGWYGVHPTEEREVRARVVRDPAMLLAGAPAIPEAADSEETWLDMSCGNIVFRVELDPVSHRIAAISYHDMHGGRLSKVRVEYSNYQNVQGIGLPFTSQTTANGRKAEPEKIDAYAINPLFPVWAVIQG